MRWPWSRRDDETRPAEPSPPPAPELRRDWTNVPSMPVAMPTIQRVADVDRFTSSSFTSWKSPVVLGPLAHALDPAGPIGLVSGLTATVAPVTHRPEAPTPAPVQRQANPSMSQLRMFPMPLPGPRIVASEPAPAETVGVAPAVSEPVAEPAVVESSELVAEPAVSVAETVASPEQEAPTLGRQDSVPATPFDPAAAPPAPVQRLQGSPPAPAVGAPSVSPLLGATAPTPASPDVSATPIQRSAVPGTPTVLPAMPVQRIAGEDPPVVGAGDHPATPTASAQAASADAEEVTLAPFEEAVPGAESGPETPDSQPSAPLLGDTEARPVARLNDPTAPSPVLPQQPLIGAPTPPSVNPQLSHASPASPPPAIPVQRQAAGSAPSAPFKTDSQPFVRRLGLGAPIAAVPQRVAADVPVVPAPPDDDLSPSAIDPEDATPRREPLDSAPPTSVPTLGADNVAPAADPPPLPTLGTPPVPGGPSAASASTTLGAPTAATVQRSPSSAGPPVVVARLASLDDSTAAGSPAVALLRPPAPVAAPLLGHVPIAASASTASTLAPSAPPGHAAPRTPASPVSPATITASRWASTASPLAPTASSSAPTATTTAMRTAATPPARPRHASATPPPWSPASPSMPTAGPGTPLDPGSIVTGAGIAQRQADGSIVFDAAIESDLLPGATVAVGQAAGVSPPPPTSSAAAQRAVADDSAQPPAPVAVQPETAAAPAPGPSGGTGAGNLDELAKQLYGRIRTQLVAELRVDRERAGLGVGLER